MIKAYTGHQYSLFRGVFGLYLVIHFVMLLPWAAETFSSAGMLPHGASSPLISAFPNMFAWVDAPAFVMGVVASAAVAALCFAIGVGDRCAALWLWYVLTCLFGRNPLTGNPSLPFVGWMLLFHVAVPPAPAGSLRAWRHPEQATEWGMPRALFTVAWVLMALAYSYSGYTKLVSPSWIDGTAFEHLLNNPLARPSGLRELLLQAPPLLFTVLTWGALGLELAFAPLALVRQVRPFLWAGMLGLHLGLIVLIDFVDLSLGMIMVHVLTFDPSWLRRKQEVNSQARHGEAAAHAVPG